MNFFTKLRIKLTCEKVGVDEFFNEYFIDEEKNKRYVIYNGMAEPSKVPAHWHAWLHFATNQIPLQSSATKYSWQKIHLPNLSGTKYAHAPYGDKRKGGVRKKVSADYESWNPNSIK